MKLTFFDKLIREFIYQFNKVTEGFDCLITYNNSSVRGRGRSSNICFTPRSGYLVVLITQVVVLVVREQILTATLVSVFLQVVSIRIQV